MSWLNMSSTARALASVFQRDHNNVEVVQAGATYRRVHQDQMEETAEVLSVAEDPYGIPHVRFQVSFRRPNRNFFDGGARMLALASFTDRYKEQVPS
jgi:hypothetical protein